MEVQVISWPKNASSKVATRPILALSAHVECSAIIRHMHQLSLRVVCRRLLFLDAG